MKQQMVLVRQRKVRACQATKEFCANMILDGHIIDGWDAILNKIHRSQGLSARSKLVENQGAVAATTAPYVSCA